MITSFKEHSVKSAAEYVKWVGSVNEEISRLECLLECPSPNVDLAPDDKNSGTAYIMTSGNLAINVLGSEVELNKKQALLLGKFIYDVFIGEQEEK